MKYTESINEDNSKDVQDKDDERYFVLIFIKKLFNLYRFKEIRQIISDIKKDSKFFDES